MRVSKIVTYLESVGWRRSESPTKRLLVFVGPKDDFGTTVELVLPEHGRFVDSGRRIEEALELLAATEDISVEELIQGIRQKSSWSSWVRGRSTGIQPLGAWTYVAVAVFVSFWMLSLIRVLEQYGLLPSLSFWGSTGENVLCFFELWVTMATPALLTWWIIQIPRTEGVPVWGTYPVIITLAVAILALLGAFGPFPPSVTAVLAWEAWAITLAILVRLAAESAYERRRISYAITYPLLAPLNIAMAYAVWAFLRK